MIPHCMDDFARRRQLEQAIQNFPIEPMARPLHRGAYRPIAHPHAGPAMPLHQWPSLPAWALMGLAMGILVVWGICS